MDDLWVIPVLFLVAALYSSVGHGGASGYLMVMALAAWAPESMRPTALVLNLLVSSLAAWHFIRQGAFRPVLFWSAAATAMPLAFLGGRTRLDEGLYSAILAAVLLWVAWRLFTTTEKSRAGAADKETRKPNPAALAASGAGIGWLSGAIGVGGGIFLTPLLLLMRWASAREAAAVSAPFIFVNSAAGLLGARTEWHNIPSSMPWLALAAIAGGWLGARWGSALPDQRAARALRRALAAVLLVAAGKMLALG